MHELAACRLSTKVGDVDGHVVAYEGEMLTVTTEESLEGRGLGDEVRVTVLDPVRGVCRYVGLLGDLDGHEVGVVVLERSMPDQRRSAARAYYRVDCAARLDSGGPLPVTVVDISATGVRFVTGRRLEHGDVVRFTMPTDGDDVDLVARVLRIEEGRHEWRYGCELLGLSERTRETLFRLVLGLQRAAARRRAEARA